MLNQQEIDFIKRLHSQGHSISDIAKETGVCRQTVSRHLKSAQKPVTKKKRVSKTSVLVADFVIEYYKNFERNTSVLYRHMCEEPSFYGLTEGCNFSLRALQDYIKEHHVEEQKTFAEAEVNPFHCLPGSQLQIDFTERFFKFADGKEKKIYIFEAVYSWSHKIYCCVLPDKKQRSWFQGIANTVMRFGVPGSILCDNDKSLIVFNNGKDYIVNPGFQYFCDRLKVIPKPCRPYSAKTKGRVERAGSYIKGNCINYIQNHPNSAIYNLEDLQIEIEKWLDSEHANRRKFFDPRTTQRGKKPKKATVEELYRFEKKYLSFPELSMNMLMPKFERLVINKKGSLSLFGQTIQIKDERCWGSVADVCVYGDGEYRVSTEGGATITKGKLDSKYLREFTITDKKKTRKEKATSNVESCSTEAQPAIRHYGERGLCLVDEDIEELTLEANSTRKELNELFDGD